MVDNRMFKVKVIPTKEALPGLSSRVSYFDSPSYKELFQGLNAEIILIQEFGSYQGDYLYIFRAEEGRYYGFLNFSYGSCSACDSLLGCTSYEDLDTLRVSLINNIEWLSPMKLINYLKQKDFPATIAGCELHQSEKFIADAMKIILTEEEIKTLDVLGC